MPYVDMDFILAIIKESDSLKDSAVKLYSEHKGNIWASPAIIIEALLICSKKHINPEDIVASIYQLVDVRGMDMETSMRAAHFMRSKGLNVLDAVHASFAFGDIIVSSDKKYSSIGN